MKRALALGIATLVAAAGCAPAAPHARAPVPPLPPRPPASAVQQPLPDLPATQLDEESAKVAPRRLYTLAVRNGNIRDVLLAFGKRTEFNIVFGPDVEGTVTVDLKRVTLEEALDALLSPIGLTYRQEGNFIRVAKPALETRIFTLNYVSTVRSGTAGLSATAGGGGTGGAGASSTVGSTDAFDLWTDLQRTITAFLSPSGKATIGRTAGLVAVTDFPANIRKVAQYLEILEGSVQRQVMIEAQILEVTLSKDFQAGINWSLIGNNLRVSPFNTLHGTVTPSTTTAATTAAVAAQALSVASTAFQIGVATKIAGQTLEILLSALSTQGVVNILSSPKLSTLNNQKAVMKVAVDDVFFTTTRQREPVTGVVTETVTAQTITEGIVLDVTPYIGDDDAIIMNIRPSISERVGLATNPQGGAVPILAVRAADTVVRVKDGYTIVIGGLMQNRSSRNTRGVPGLQDVPVVGHLFRQRVDEDRKTELVILLTPTVLIGRRHSELTPQEIRILRETGRPLPAR